MISINGFALPEEMKWVDEFEWAQVTSSVKRTIQGKFIIQESTMPSDAGRKITLASDDAWATRADVVYLRNLVDIPDGSFTLLMHDLRTYNCAFRHWDAPCFSAEMVVPTAFPIDATWYKITLKLAVVI